MKILIIHERSATKFKQKMNANQNQRNAYTFSRMKFIGKEQSQYFLKKIKVNIVYSYKSNGII